MYTYTTESCKESLIRRGKLRSDDQTHRFLVGQGEKVGELGDEKLTLSIYIASVSAPTTHVRRCDSSHLSWLAQRRGRAAPRNIADALSFLSVAVERAVQ